MQPPRSDPQAILAAGDRLWQLGHLDPIQMRTVYRHQNHPSRKAEPLDYPGMRPSSGARDGPLPPLLLSLTAVTGLVDADSYLKLGHVFVANMTGNVVFLGFAIAGAGGLSVGASLFAIAAFLAGSIGGGRLGARLGDNRATLLVAATSIQAVAVAVAAGLAAAVGDHPGRPARDGLIVLLAVAMGLQNAVARRLAVPDLTTTVLTLTLTGIGADSSIAGGPGAKSGRRLLAVAAMLLGALAGGLLALHVSIAAPLAAATAVLAAVAVATHRLGGPDAAWTSVS
jgi:uncharacterized membrane protein YoaK (UPF0700 family)